ncbi:MAG: hypothetical protein QMC36_08850 [Patescibacteria group bacterium]
MTFSVENLSDGSKTCNDLSIAPGAVRDSEGLANEGSVSGGGVTDAQYPTISISSPTA